MGLHCMTSLAVANCQTMVVALAAVCRMPEFCFTSCVMYGLLAERVGIPLRPQVLVYKRSPEKLVFQYDALYFACQFDTCCLVYQSSLSWHANSGWPSVGERVFERPTSYQNYFQNLLPNPMPNSYQLSSALGMPNLNTHCAGVCLAGYQKGGMY